MEIYLLSPFCGSEVIVLYPHAFYAPINVKPQGGGGEWGGAG